jgi:hypothetical protein
VGAKAMTTKISTQPQKNVVKVLWDVTGDQTKELLAFCPGCKALETINYGPNGLASNRRFIQKDKKVYHYCGSGIPCRLYSPS